jgi:hypothetical protein
VKLYYSCPALAGSEIRWVKETDAVFRFAETIDVRDVCFVKRTLHKHIVVNCTND